MHRYRLIEQLGVGGMSVVWRGYDEVLGRPVAVKQLTTAADPRSHRRIQAEARAAALLSHPNIAAVHDFGHTPDGAPFVVMELVEGESLEERLQGPDGGALPVAEALRIAARLGSALAAVHARGLVHHDVKPANVMLTADGPKLVDFGISAVSGYEPDQLLGTPAYLAPERTRGIPPSPATDVYALGLVLYRMLAGALPWPVTTTEAMLLAHRKLRPAPLPATVVLPAEVADLLRRCLAKAPANRPAAAEVAATLTAARPVATGWLSLQRLPALTRLPASTKLTELTARLGPGGPVKRRVYATTAAVLLLGLVGTAAAHDRTPVAAWSPATPATAPSAAATQTPSTTTPTTTPTIDAAAVPVTVPTTAAPGGLTGGGSGGGSGGGAGPAAAIVAPPPAAEHPGKKPKPPKANSKKK